jgi:hypothetical protein
MHNRTSILLPALLLSACYLACGVPHSNVTLVVDKRATPGWVFVELKNECPPPEGSLENPTFRVDARGYGCSSRGLPDRPIKLQIVVRDQDSGEESATNCGMFHHCLYSEVDEQCDGLDSRSRYLVFKFSNTGPGISDYDRIRRLKQLGLGCRASKDSP